MCWEDSWSWNHDTRTKILVWLLLIWMTSGKEHELWEMLSPPSLLGFCPCHLIVWKRSFREKNGEPKCHGSSRCLFQHSSNLIHASRRTVAVGPDGRTEYRSLHCEFLWRLSGQKGICSWTVPWNWEAHSFLPQFRKVKPDEITGRLWLRVPVGGEVRTGFNWGSNKYPVI